MPKRNQVYESGQSSTIDFNEFLRKEALKNVLSKSQDLDDLEPDQRLPIENEDKTQQQNNVNDHAPDLGVSMAEEPIPPGRKSKSERPQFIGTSFVVENKVNEWLERNEKQNEQAKVPDEDLEKDYLKARIFKKTRISQKNSDEFQLSRFDITLFRALLDCGIFKVIDLNYLKLNI